MKTWYFLKPECFHIIIDPMLSKSSMPASKKISNTLGLHSANHGRHTSLCIQLKQHNLSHGFVSCPAEVFQKTTGETEVHEQALWNGKYQLTMWDVCKHFVG